MTTLAAFQGNGWAVIGCDSRASDEGGRVMDLATPKVIENNGYLIAVSGASRGGNISQFGWTPPLPPKSTDLDVLDRFMTKRFIPALRKAFIAAGYDAKDDGDAAWQDSNLLVIFNGVIYPIFNDYSWDREVRNIYYGGSGGDVALGAMVAYGIQDMKDNPKAAEEVIRKSVEHACSWDAYTNGPVITRVQRGKAPAKSKTKKEKTA
jgi:ATP-dependent protease HslVU (ClpYQ) peptidase subunit